MEHICSACGTTISEDLQGRFFPEDDSHLCERCFPLSPGDGEPTEFEGGWPVRDSGHPLLSAEKE